MTQPIDIAAWLPLISIVTAAVGGAAAYHGAKSAMLVQLARIEEQYAALKARFDSDHAELERLQHDFYSRRGGDNAN